MTLCGRGFSSELPLPFSFARSAFPSVRFPHESRPIFGNKLMRRRHCRPIPQCEPLLNRVEPLRDLFKTASHSRKLSSGGDPLSVTVIYNLRYTSAPD